MSYPFCDTMPPRPSSRKGSGKKTKEKPKPPKKIIAELTEENELLKQQLEAAKTEAAQALEKLRAVSQKIANNVRRKDFGVADDADVMLLSTDMLLQMLDTLVVKKQVYDVSVEARVDELEGRVTQMNLDLAKMTKKTFAYESGLQYITSMNDIETIKDKVYDLQLLAGEAYHTFSTTDPAKTTQDVLNGYHDEQPNEATCRSLETAFKLNLVKPVRKLPGDTHVRNMHKDLRLYVMKELSREKASGSDWRMLGERVGISAEDITYWKSLNLDLPMGRVLADWESRPGSTVRMLHRHLMSPALRCTLTAKRISDFYEVD